MIRDSKNIRGMNVTPRVPIPNLATGANIMTRSKNGFTLI